MIFAAPPPTHPELHRRIGWICHLSRLALLAYPVWVAASLLMFWTDPPLVARALAIADVAGPRPLGYAGAVALSGIVWLMLSATCLRGWQLFSAYLAGNILSSRAAALLGEIGVWGVATLVIDFVSRPLTAMLIGGDVLRRIEPRPDDLGFLLLFVALIVLGQIYRAAADIAREHAEFV